MAKISKVHALEILDSRGNPTVEAQITLDDDTTATASAPSGASTGLFEAVELRDKEESRYFGKGVTKAVENVNKVISLAILGIESENQQELDDKLIETDNTPNKANLGANAILAVSLANAKATARSKKIPLWKWLHEISGLKSSPGFPTPTFNIINGGAHADNNLAVQEFMVVPKNIDQIDAKIHAGVKITQHLMNILKENHLDTALGNEGGFAPSEEPNLEKDEDALDFIMEAIERAGYTPGKEIFIAMDVAISQYFDKESGIYKLPNQSSGDVEGEAQAIIDHFDKLSDKYPFISIEDALDEDDWGGWPRLTKMFSDKNVLSVGDDFTVTNPERVQKAIDSKAITAMIVKPNQIGTLSEVLEVLRLCENNKITPIISHRSGETADVFISHLAYGTGAEFIKTGAPKRSERVEKYNELLRIQDSFEE